MNSKEEFLAEFLRIDRESRRIKDTSYGANVMPFLKLYASLSNLEGRRAFQDALEEWLGSTDSETRQKAVNICIGFFVFRDAI
jgi:hypothetical protein